MVSTLTDNNPSPRSYPVARSRGTPKARQRNQQRGQLDKKLGNLTEPTSEASLADLSLLNPDSSLSLYFREMGQVALLSPTEEVSLAKQIEKGHRAEQKLAEAAGEAVEKEYLE